MEKPKAEPMNGKEENKTKFRDSSEKKSPKGGIRITWKGTASFLLEAAGERLLFDPFVQIRGGENPAALEEFLNEETIFITHGHFDHLYWVPQLLEEGEATVFCTACPAETLERFTEETGRVVRIRVGDCIPIGGMKIWVRKGRHIDFQIKRIFETMSPLRVLRHWRNLPFLLWANHTFKDGNETVAFEIQAEGRRILLLGSLALDEREVYPQGADLVILPYSGNHDLVAEADRVVERLRPKRILLSHFDDAFPPMSRSVDTRPFYQMMQQKWPEIAVAKPKKDKPIRL